MNEYRLSISGIGGHKKQLTLRPILPPIWWVQISWGTTLDTPLHQACGHISLYSKLPKHKENVHLCSFFFSLWDNSLTRALTASLLSTPVARKHTHTKTNTNKTHRNTRTLGRLWASDELVVEAATFTTHNRHKRTSMPSAGFEPAIPTIERLQICVLDLTATRIGSFYHLNLPYRIYGKVFVISICLIFYFTCVDLGVDGL